MGCAGDVSGQYVDTPSGYKYATIDGTSYSLASSACQKPACQNGRQGVSYPCQSGAYNLPTGWELAPPDSDGIRIANVGGWGTHVVVYSTGAAYKTSNYGTGLWNPGMLTTSTLNGAPAYGVGSCSLRVLIRAPSACSTCTKSLGQVKCAAGTALSELQCRAYAADTANKNFASAWPTTSYPSGCWAYHGAAQVYYNTYPGNFVSTYDAAPICTSASGNPTCV